MSGVAYQPTLENFRARDTAERLSVFGLGYVGSVCSACFAQMGHFVVGVDPNPAKVEPIVARRSPIVEKDTNELISEAVAGGRLEATADVGYAVNTTEISLICVGTPSLPNGALNLDAVRHVSRQIGDALRTKAKRHAIVVRSTALPGTLRTLVQPEIEQASGKRAGVDFDLAVNPEFLREGTAVADFYDPARTIVGADSASSADRVMALYEKLPGERIVTRPEIAELAKYIDNSWHALKVAFGNEIGSVCKSLGIDSHAAMDIFLADRKLNVSGAYLRPGFAFGGSCLPKDLRALDYFARSKDIALPVIRSILKSNVVQVERGVFWILAQQKRKVAFLGFSFKAGTDDLRESPYLEVIERLIGKGCDIRIYDPNVAMGRLVGANLDFLLNRIPHVAELLVPNLEDAVSHGDVVVLTHSDRVYDPAIKMLRPDQRLLDFSRNKPFENERGAYDGFAW